MTTQIRRSRRANAEIEEIAAYLAEHNPLAAERFLAALERAQWQLAEFPNSGAPGAVEGTRRLVVGNYIVSYRRAGEEVEIFAIRHARRRDARPG
ncbi:MAG: type II toxin-antitoxin system RelE/ParE family toxin [Stellaceae bacterium]